MLNLTELDRCLGTNGMAVLTAAHGTAPEPVIASPAYDMWCFGVLLYELATGLTLFQIDVREEAVDDVELAKIVKWSDSGKKRKLMP